MSVDDPPTAPRPPVRDFPAQFRPPGERGHHHTRKAQSALAYAAYIFFSGAALLGPLVGLLAHPAARFV